MNTLDDEEKAVVDAAADWVDREVKPQVRALEHANAYPGKLIGQMGDMSTAGPRKRLSKPAGQAMSRHFEAVHAPGLISHRAA
jgi:hypothetical protein